MDKVDIAFQDLLNNMNVLLGEKKPLLLASVDAQGRPNIMTVGATAIGADPYHHVCQYIRPSCYTTKLIEETFDYTLNLPSEGMEDISVMV